MTGYVGIKVPDQFSHIKVAVTFTPDIAGLVNWHWKNYAFDTRFIARNARNRYKEPNVHYMCYLSPGYTPRIGQRSSG